MKKFFQKITPSTSKNYSYVREQRRLAHILSESQYFRAMAAAEEEAVTLIDNRNLNEPENRVLLLCEYASNDIKGSPIDRAEEHLL